MPPDIRMPITASEQMRTAIVESWLEITKHNQEMLLNRFGKHKTKANRINIQSKALTFYSYYIRPYLVSYNSTSIPKAKADEFMTYMDYFALGHLKDFTIKDAQNATMFMGHFLVDSGILSVLPKKTGL